MGRTLKRVPLDFQWPENKIWEGFVNPHYVKCPQCNGSGSTPALKRLTAIACLIGLSGEEALGKPRHSYLTGGAFDNYGGGLTLSEGSIFSEFLSGLDVQKPSVFGYDTHDITSALKEKAGLPRRWGWCPVCDGDGVHPDHKDKYEAWEPAQPPTGEGFQLWETTSEGSPISPVFKTLRELCEYAATNCSTFGTSCWATADEWEKMLNRDFVCHQEDNMVFI